MSTHSVQTSSGFLLAILVGLLTPMGVFFVDRTRRDVAYGKPQSNVNHIVAHTDYTKLPENKLENVGQIQVESQRYI